MTDQSDGNADEDVFLYDNLSGDVVLVSHTGDGTTAGEDGAENPVISADGAFIAFQSFADDLVPGSGSNSNIFLYDRVGGTVSLVSHTGDGVTGSDGNSMDAVISDDGGFVAFTNASDNLVAGLTKNNSDFDVFLFERDSGSGTVTLVSHTGDGTTTGDLVSEDPVISRDGTFVAFESGASDLVSGFQDNNGSRFGDPGDVFLFDRLANTLRLVSHTGDNLSGGNDDSSDPVISDDGGFIAFNSQANNLVPGQTEINFASDVFLYAEDTETISLISNAGDGTTTGNDGTDSPNISGDGSTVTFSSRATDLADSVADGNGQKDALYFTSFGDAPTPFEIQSIQLNADGSVDLFFDSNPGSTYYLEYSGTLDNFTRSTEFITAETASSFFTDNGRPLTDSPPSESGRRFYRIVEEQ